MSILALVAHRGAILLADLLFVIVTALNFAADFNRRLRPDEPGFVLCVDFGTTLVLAAVSVYSIILLGRAW